MPFTGEVAGLQACPVFTFESVGDYGSVSHSTSNSNTGSVEFRASVPGTIGTVTVYLQCQTIIQVTRHRSPADCYTTNNSSNQTLEGELTANRWNIVSVVGFHIVLGISQTNRAYFQFCFLLNKDRLPGSGKAICGRSIVFSPSSLDSPKTQGSYNRAVFRALSAPQT